MNGARLYGRYVAASLRAQMQYPASFIATSVGAFAATVIDFIGLWALFARFRQIEAWGFEEARSSTGSSACRSRSPTPSRAASTSSASASSRPATSTACS